MLKELRPYQEADAAFLSTLQGGGCFNEQRTGKTPTALRVFECRNVRRFVVICPASAVYIWADEIEQWTGASVFPAVGCAEARRHAIDSWKSGALILSYDVLKSINGKNVQRAGEVARILAAKPEGVIVDEAHRIRNRNSAQAKAVYQLCKVPARLALTGTPAPGKSHDIWGILHFLCPNTFKSFWNFIDEFYVSVRRSNPHGRDYIDIMHLKPGKDKVMQYILSRISTQRKRKDVMPWLPVEEPPQKVRLPLTEQQQKYLEELKHFWETEHVITQGTLDRLMRYRQICLAPQLLGLAGSSPKLDWIAQYLTDYPEKHVLIFSKFTSFLKLIKEQNPEVGVIVGATPLKERRELQVKFQQGILRTLLLQIDAGKEALTLDKAEVAIFTDKYPPIGDIDQAEDRFVATTPDKAGIPKVIIELMMKGSYDEQIYKLLESRKSETDIINDYKNYMRKE